MNSNEQDGAPIFQVNVNIPARHTDSDEVKQLQFSHRFYMGSFR